MNKGVIKGYESLGVVTIESQWEKDYMGNNPSRLIYDGHYSRVLDSHGTYHTLGPDMLKHEIVLVEA